MPSSVIRAFDYDAQARQLTVTFVTGKHYAYLDVPQAVADALRFASSKGEYFNDAIRGHFRFERLRTGSSETEDSAFRIGDKSISRWG
jgi:hypothetical protein